MPRLNRSRLTRGMSEFTLSPLLSAASRARILDLDAEQRGRRRERLLGVARVDRRRNGPRWSANGGYAAGTLARYADSDVVSVRLVRTVPLGRPLAVVDSGAGTALVSGFGGRLVATVRPGRLSTGEPPRIPDFEEALVARAAHPLTGVHHPLSDCYVCGPRRTDGMHVTPGPVPGYPQMLAAPWVVRTDDAVSGQAEFAAVWAAMDCTSFPAAALDDRVLCLLGTMTAAVERRPRVGERLVVCSWTREEVGRRHETSVLIVDEGGATVARADATWVALRHQRLHRMRMRPHRAAAPSSRAVVLPGLD